MNSMPLMGREIAFQSYSRFASLRFAAALACATTVIVLGCDATPGPNTSIPDAVVDTPFWGDDRMALTSACGDAPPSYFHDPVAIEPFEGSRYFVANYESVMMLDIDAGTVCRMMHDYRGLWNPTGVSYSKLNRLLYVANYNDNRVLIFRVEADRLRLVGQIETARSPEGVFISADGRRLAVANYDGQSIQMFDPYTGKELWTTVLGLRHGVCIVGNRVYGTVLSDASLVEFEVETGKVLRRVGAKGLDESRLETVWPTYVYPYGDDKLLLADGLGGAIFVIDRATLRPLEVFGHNGPSHRYFVMPYCAIADGDKILVGSEAQDRIVVLERRDEGFHAVKSLNRFPNEWEYVRERIDASGLEVLPVVRGRYWEFPACTGCWRLDIFGGTYNAGFRSLTRVAGSAPPAFSSFPFRVPDQLFLATPRGGIYSEDFLYTTTLPTKRGYIFVSSRHEIAVYFTTIGGIPYYVPFRVERGSWVFDGEIWGPRAHGFTTELITTLDDRVSRLAMVRAPNGYVSPDQVREAFFNHPFDVQTLVGPRVSGDFVTSFASLLALSFDSEPGTEFWNQYAGFDEQTPASVMTQAVRRYYDAVPNQSIVRLPEYALVAMLTGYPIQ